MTNGEKHPDYVPSEERETNEYGRPLDSNGIPYSPDSGTDEPQEGRCNCLLDNWRERYGEKRFCGQYPENHFQPDDPDASAFCRMHSNREDLYMNAKEMLKHGLYTQTIEHFYDKVNAWEKVFIWGIYESMLEESIYDYEADSQERTFDFSDEDITPSVADDDGVVSLNVKTPNAKFDRAMALWNAAVDGVKMTRVNAILNDENMQNHTTSHAQLTSPTEDDPTQVFETIEEVTEHHLNLPYSRLVRDRKELLEYGGVGVDEPAQDDSAPDAVVEYYENPLDEEPVSPESVKTQETGGIPAEEIDVE